MDFLLPLQMQPMTFEVEIHFPVNNFSSFIDNLKTDCNTFHTAQKSHKHTLTSGCRPNPH